MWPSEGFIERCLHFQLFNLTSRSTDILKLKCKTYKWTSDSQCIIFLFKTWKHAIVDIPVGVVICFSVNGRWPRPCSTTYNTRTCSCHITWNRISTLENNANETKYQANQSICIEDKVMVCCFSITDKCVHPTYLIKIKDMLGLIQLTFIII